MGSGGIARHLRGISRRSKPWEKIYDPFPSVNSVGRLPLGLQPWERIYRGKRRGTKNHLNRSSSTETVQRQRNTRLKQSKQFFILNRKYVFEF